MRPNVVETFSNLARLDTVVSGIVFLDSARGCVFATFLVRYLCEACWPGGLVKDVAG